MKNTYALKTRPFVVECLLRIAMASVLQTDLPIDRLFSLSLSLSLSSYTATILIPPIQFWTLLILLPYKTLEFGPQPPNPRNVSNPIHPPSGPHTPKQQQKLFKFQIFKTRPFNSKSKKSK